MGFGHGMGRTGSELNREVGLGGDGLVGVLTQSQACGLMLFCSSKPKVVLPMAVPIPLLHMPAYFW